MYASYIVKFVCYFLRIIVDGEARIARMKQRGDDTDDSSSAYSERGDLTSNWGRSGSQNNENQNDGSTRPRLRRRRRKADTMKDARELFRWD